MLWNYRGFILGSVKREFQSKFRNSILGAAWAILNPMAMIVVYTLIFSEIMRARLPGVDSKFAYSIYLCAGVLTWGLFSEIVNRAQNTFIENANLLKKLSFPRICLPIIVVANAMLNFLIIFGLFSVFLLVTGNFHGPVYLALIPVVAILMLFSIGLGISLGVLNVFFRDTGQFFSIVLQFWFWFTPIVYPTSILPELVRPLMNFNPMVVLITTCQDIIVSGKWPIWHNLVPVTVLALGLCAIGIWMFRKHVGEMVDEL